MTERRDAACTCGRGDDAPAICHADTCPCVDWVAGPLEGPSAASSVPRAVGRYLGMFVMLYGETGDGWIEARSPDREQPGRSHGKERPLTFAGDGPDSWSGRLWRDQVEVLMEIPSCS